MEAADVLTALRTAFPADVLEAGESFGDPVVRLHPGAIPAAAAFLRGEPWSFTMLLDLTCVDHPGRPDRFEMVYHLLSLAGNVRIRLKADLPAEAPEIGSLTPLWRNADWLEREVFDMFGVGFAGHPDLRRLLMYDGFEGHPLRKDFPLRNRQPILPPRERT